MSIYSPPKAYSFYDDDLAITKEGLQLRRKGIKYLRENGLCVVILAGGQGTRLGSDLPKGCYKLPMFNISLFEIHCEVLKEAQRLFETEIKLIIMTSSHTHDHTVKFFKNNEFFGMKRENIYFYQQTSEVCVDIEGKKLPFYKKFATAPNGNGSVFKMFSQYRLFDSVLKNIKYCSIISVDNVLAKAVDPISIALLESNGWDVCNKSVTKNENENVGVFINKNGSLMVKEYSELQTMCKSQDDSKKKNVLTDVSNINQENSLRNIKSPNRSQESINQQIDTETDEEKIPLEDLDKYVEGNICNHLFRVSFLKTLKDVDLPIHKAFKKIPYTDKNNNLIEPKEPNGYKSELFIFDCLEFTKKAGLINVPRCFEFAPVKNAPNTGVDDPETAVIALKRKEMLTKYDGISTENVEYGFY
ncbi:hypothetical protein EDEG_01104 [Edhazardia aedis USNM 41457]|uniref:UDP-N-acetylglucosamine diphosphorylase n=1 Tax=Edhazardia aedis (strain USNM 41457) TaxID=1003232 RepID=J9DAC8_EDHAE|nr:hypothetical protein EDEG_01104 [Edhazardia aedis USNM 41457]|eukprot:EJW04691.1 hypothetical protein EDEG_01104 [Edhazardia aedis USNM 41457]